MNQPTEALPELLAKAKPADVVTPVEGRVDREPTDGRASHEQTGDRFDRVPRNARAGVHRAAKSTTSKWTAFVVGALATILLTALGILVVTMQPESVSFVEQLRDSPEQSEGRQATQQAQAEINAETTVVLLNGTAVDGFAFLVDEIINDEGWGTTLFSGEADRRDVEISAIFYGDEGDAGLARGLGEKLGGISYYQSSDYTLYGNQLTVLIGSDYRGPAAEYLKDPSE